MDNSELVADGGVFTRKRALALGLAAPELNTLLRAGTLTVLRPGWYAIGSCDAAVERAVKAGGVLSCVSALARYEKIWIPPGVELHVRRSRYSRRRKRGSPVPKVRSKGDQAKGKRRAAAGCLAYKSLPAPPRAVDDVGVALACAARCLSDEHLVAVLDSALHHRLIQREDLADIFEGAPRRVLRLLDELDEKAESGTESLVRFRLRRLGIAVQTQQSFDGVGRVDLLVGKRMILECDSREHHLGDQYQTDRSRDRVSLVDGRFTVRLTYKDVVYDWPNVLPQLLALIRRREHRIRETSTRKGAGTDTTAA